MKKNFRALLPLYGIRLRGRTQESRRARELRQQLLAAVAMGGAPVVSGVAFAKAVEALGERLEAEAGALYAANTVGSVLGSWLGGLVVLPLLEARGAVILFAAVAGLAGSLVLRRVWPLAAVAVLAALLIIAGIGFMLLKGRSQQADDEPSSSPSPPAPPPDRELDDEVTIIKSTNTARPQTPAFCQVRLE